MICIRGWRRDSFSQLREVGISISTTGVGGNGLRLSTRPASLITPSTTCAIPMRPLPSTQGFSRTKLARYMGTSLRMIDSTYGHLVRGSEFRAREKLEARAAREFSDEATDGVH